MIRFRNSVSQGRVSSKWFYRLAIQFVGGAVFLSGCSSSEDFIRTPSFLNPAGPQAQNIASLSWVFIGLGSLVFIGVMTYLAYALFRSQRYDLKEELAHPDRGSRTVLVWGAGFTALILVILFGLNIVTMAANNNVKGTNLTVEVIGRQWWWEINYPDAGFETANEIHIPVGQPVTIRLTTKDVIHSFWVPELNGKLDTIPGQTNTFVLQADRPGEYWGECAEYCGTQHAKMKLLVIAKPEEEFLEWVAGQQEEPEDQLEGTLAFEGQQIFLGSACVYCHTVRGTNATGDLGPDLTHLASRRTLGAGILENTTGSLAGWIINSQHIKPGNQMPPMDLSGSELQAVLAYMETLK